MGTDSLLKYAARIMGIPALTTAVGVYAATKDGLEKTIPVAQKISASLQCLPKESHLAAPLSAMIRVSAQSQYGESHAFFTLSSYDGALKLLDSTPSDLYLIEITNGSSGLTQGQRFLIWAKHGISHVKGPQNSYRVLAELNKRGSTVTTAQLNTFLGTLTKCLVEQQQNIQKAFHRASPTI